MWCWVVSKKKMTHAFFSLMILELFNHIFDEKTWRNSNGISENQFILKLNFNNKIPQSMNSNEKEEKMEKEKNKKKKNQLGFNNVYIFIYYYFIFYELNNILKLQVIFPFSFIFLFMNSLLC